MTDREFATEVLHEGLGARHVAVGFDNSFGKGRTGTPDTMRQYGEELGFGVSVADRWGRRRREVLLHRGARGAARRPPEVAAEILGRPFAIEGRCSAAASWAASWAIPPPTSTWPTT
jgi:riboflavin kinase/FMN adenylyltransferase